MSTTPEPLPSIPPSPTPTHTDDIAHAWHDDEPSGSRERKRLSASSKGKKRAGSGERELNRSDTDNEEDGEEANGAVEGYPPTKEEVAESRRIEENLRRWEIAERQRRKAARESVASTSGGSTAPSLLADLRASLFKRESHSSRKASLGGVGTHHVLHDADADAEGDTNDSLALAEMRSRTPTLGAPLTPEPENPFDTPNASRTSLNIPAHSAIMTESESVPAGFADPDQRGTGDGAGPQRPTLEASSSHVSPGRRMSKQPPPPPKPLVLPAPREPPPRTETPRADKPPEPIPPPTPAPVEREEPVDPGPPVRWWHEWLCGCGEGGEHQAGRTNPFE